MNRYLVIAIREPHFDPSVSEPHHAFLDELRRQGKLELAGPFSDKTGGAYLLLAPDLEAAQALAWSDPLHLTGSSKLAVYEWRAA